jgi:hypothetical protein
MRVKQGLQCSVLGALFTLHLTKYTKCNDGVKKHRRCKFKHRKLQSVNFLHRFFFGVEKTLYSTLICFFKTPHSVFLKHRFLIYTVYYASVIFGNISISVKKYTALLVR